jgi:hypothetical protein
VLFLSSSLISAHEFEIIPSELAYEQFAYDPYSGSTFSVYGFTPFEQPFPFRSPAEIENIEAIFQHRNIQNEHFRNPWLSYGQNRQYFRSEDFNTDHVDDLIRQIFQSVNCNPVTYTDDYNSNYHGFKKNPIKKPTNDVVLNKKPEVTKGEENSDFIYNPDFEERPFIDVRVDERKKNNTERSIPEGRNRSKQNKTMRHTTMRPSVTTKLPEISTVKISTTGIPMTTLKPLTSSQKPDEEEEEVNNYNLPYAPFSVGSPSSFPMRQPIRGQIHFG